MAPPGPPLLSICIPTWNRRQDLAGCLDSVLRELAAVPQGLVEVVVTDNASTDDTEAYGRKMAQTHAFLRYARNDANHGAGYNLMVGADLCQGTYCWFLGDDDALLPGVLGPVLEALASGHDVYLGTRMACDKDLVPVGIQPWHAGTPEPEWDLATARERIRYFNLCTTLGGVFAFLSAQIFRLAHWRAVPLPLGPYTGSMYPQIYRILAFAGLSLRVRLLDYPLVLGRIPDLLEAAPDFRRTTRDLDALLEVARALGYHEDPAVWAAFFGVLRRNHAGDHYPRMIRLQAPDEAAWAEHVPKLELIGYPRPYLEALDRAHHALPRGTQPLLAMPAGTDLGVTWALEHLAFLLHGVRALALVSLGTEDDARGAAALAAVLKRARPDLRLLLVGSTEHGLESLGEEDRFLSLDPGALEASPGQQQALARACRHLEVGLVLNVAFPRTRPSDVACAVMPAFARLALPGPDPRVDPLYTAVLPGALVVPGAREGWEVMRLALGL